MGATIKSIIRDRALEYLGLSRQKWTVESVRFSMGYFDEICVTVSLDSDPSIKQEFGIDHNEFWMKHENIPDIALPQRQNNSKESRTIKIKLAPGDRVFIVSK